MSKINGIDRDNWKEFIDYSESLWLIDKDADKGKPKDYHGGFVLQIPLRLMHLYSKPDDLARDRL